MMGIVRDWFQVKIAGPIQQRATLSRLHLAESKLNLKLRESAFDVMDSVVSQQDEFEGWAIADDEGFWRKSNSGVTLAQMRQTMRQMVWSSGIATGAIEAVADYVIGTGFTYEWSIPKEVSDAERTLLEPLRMEANRLWKKFSEDNAWPELEAQLCEIADRDGESFLRMFVGQNGEVAVRYVDASDVGADAEGKYPTGVVTMDDDAQAVVGYLISQELVSACDVIHVALNVDPDLHRGVPTLWPVRNAIVRGEKILKAVGKLAEIQAAISLIRKHSYPTPPAEMASFLDAQADKTPTNVFTGKPLRQKMLPPGAILDIGAADELIFPTGGSTLDKFPPALLSVLRPIAVRLGLPDFVVTGDVSAANFASVFTSMAPSSKRLGRKQTKFLNHFRALHCRVRDAAIAANTLDPLASLLVSSITGPEVSNRDELAQTNKREVLARNKVLSIKTWRAEEGYDNDEEQQNIGEEAAMMGGFTTPLDGAIPKNDAAGNPIDPSKPPAASSGAPQLDPTTNLPMDPAASGAQPGAPGAPTDGTAPSGQKIQTLTALVLNGAQIASALAIVQAVANGELPRDSGVAMLKAFFNLDDAKAEEIMASSGTSAPTTPNPKPSDAGSVGAPSGGASDPNASDPPKGVTPPGLAASAAAAAQASTPPATSGRPTTNAG